MTEVDVLQQPPRFGPELRRLRLAADMTLGQLSQRVHYSKAQLSKVERGLKSPSRDLARLCDAVLGAKGELAALLRPVTSLTSETVSGPRPGDEPVSSASDTAAERTAKITGGGPGEDGEEVWLMRLSADGSSWFQPVGRRHVVAAGAASMVSLGLSTSSAAPDSGGTLLEASRALFDEYRRLGQTTAPEVVLPALIAQTHTLRELSERAGTRTRQGLLALASRYAEYVGWLVQETGNEEAALWWTDRAVNLAEAGDDHHFAAYALVRRALVTLYRDDPVQTVVLAQQAQDHDLPPRIRGLAAQREAQGHALAGDYDSCMRCLDRARVLLTREPEHGGAPVIGTTNLSDPVAMITGWCLHDLGFPQRAAAIIDREIAQVPAHALRSRARYGMRGALAHAAAGEIDHACSLVAQLLKATDTVGSATITADLRRVSRILSRYARHSGVKSLAPGLAHSLHSADR
ncbi:helix-turn-helix domain-containing protein [Streptomyces sp. NPDC054796]